MSDSGIKIEVHLIQNFAPSNLNRDDTGQPKSAYFGGFRRARVSSQCGKHAAREWWRKHNADLVGNRTKRLQQLIGERLVQDTEFMRKVVDKKVLNDGIRVFTDAYYAGADKKKPENTNVLIFIGPDEVNVCAKAIKENWDDKVQEISRKGKQVRMTIQGIASIAQEVRDFDAKNTGKKGAAGENGGDEEQAGEEEKGPDLEEAKKKPKRPKLDKNREIESRIEVSKVSADIALFGRMLAEQPGRNTDGACQIAHPISTHKVDMEMDYYTAVDDLNPAEETGAGMIGVVGFNSACYYRYALLDRDQLARNLARKTERENGSWKHELEAKDYQEADKVIKAFLEVMVYAIPSGKQHSFAARNLPSFGLFVKRKGGVPVSLANAFARPVRPKKDDDDLIGLSVDALTKHWDTLQKVYGAQGVQVTSCFHIDQRNRLNSLVDSDRGTVEGAIEAVMGNITR